MPKKIVWDEIPWEPVNKDVSRKVIMGDHLMMVLYRFGAGLTGQRKCMCLSKGDTF